MTSSSCLDGPDTLWLLCLPVASTWQPLGQHLLALKPLNVDSCLPHPHTFHPHTFHPHTFQVGGVRGQEEEARREVENKIPEEREEEEEEEEGEEPSPLQKAHMLIRRKSYLPQDFETSVALQQYNTVDKVLTPSKEA